jgi:hypothetical protein
VPASDGIIVPTEQLALAAMLDGRIQIICRYEFYGFSAVVGVDAARWHPAAAASLEENRVSLPAELKTRILESVPGVDLARVQCTCREMRILAADVNLWNKLVKLVDGEDSKGSNSAKGRFAEVWAAKKLLQKRPSPTFWNYGWRNLPLVPRRFLVIGGDSDWRLFIGNHGFLGDGFGNR